MLVLSRRLNEQILFPEFNTAVKVLGVKGNTVRLGIDAPLDVTILREEVTDLEEKSQARLKNQSLSADKANDAEREKTRQLNHLLRNRLNVAGLGLALLARQLEAGMLDDCQATLDKIHEDFDLLRDRLEVEMEPHPPVHLPRARALIVEDDRNERELLAGLLRLNGMDVDLAEDGATALDYLRARGNPDVVLMDMILPRCDGPTTVREIRKNPANNRLKIFGLTGHAPDSFQLEGVDRWFRKPLNPEVLLHDLSIELECATTGV
jgi:carbon storage regulator CsrA